MNPISEFFVEFTSKGFAELNEKLDNLTKRLDGLDKNFEKAGKSSDSFIAGFKKWAKAIGIVYALHKALKETFQVSKEIQGLYKSADMLGVDPEILEKWTLVAQLHGGNQGDATSFFSGLNEMARNLREGKYSPELMERMARYGFSEQYLYGASLPQNRDKLIGDLNRLLNRKDLDAADIQALQSVFPGLNDTMISILKTLPKDLAAELAWADQNRALSKDPDAIKNATELNKSLIELRQAFKPIWTALQHPLSELLLALKPLAAPLTELAKSVGRLLEYLAPIVKWIADKTGKVIGGVADFLGGGTKMSENILSTMPATKEDLGPLIEIETMPATPLANELSKSQIIDGKVSGFLEMNVNGQRFVQSPSGDIFNVRTGENVGRAAWASSVQGGGI